MNSLTRQAGLRLGPLVLETLIKHYFDRLLASAEGKGTTRLRKDELLYDEAFSIVKVISEFSALSLLRPLQEFLMAASLCVSYRPEISVLGDCS